MQTFVHCSVAMTVILMHSAYLRATKKTIVPPTNVFAMKDTLEMETLCVSVSASVKPGHMSGCVLILVFRSIY